jgi:hypothetical protein
MDTLSEQFLHYLEKDLKDWADAATYFEQCRTITMDGQIYSNSPNERDVVRLPSSRPARLFR